MLFPPNITRGRVLPYVRGEKMVADFIIVFCAVGILVCLIYIIFQAKKLKYENQNERRCHEKHDGPDAKKDSRHDGVYASVEEKHEE